MLMLDNIELFTVPLKTTKGKASRISWNISVKSDHELFHQILRTSSEAIHVSLNPTIGWHIVYSPNTSLKKVDVATKTCYTNFNEIPEAWGFRSVIWTVRLCYCHQWHRHSGVNNANCHLIKKEKKKKRVPLQALYTKAPVCFFSMHSHIKRRPW